MIYSIARKRKNNVYLDLVCGLWPSGETGLAHSGYLQQPALSLGIISGMSVDIKFNREVRMKDGNKTQTQQSAVKLKAKVIVNFRVIVVALVGFLMTTPLTRAYK